MSYTLSRVEFAKHAFVQRDPWRLRLTYCDGHDAACPRRAKYVAVELAGMHLSCCRRYKDVQGIVVRRRHCTTSKPNLRRCSPAPSLRSTSSCLSHSLRSPCREASPRPRPRRSPRRDLPPLAPRGIFAVPATSNVAKASAAYVFSASYSTCRRLVDACAFTGR